MCIRDSVADVAVKKPVNKLAASGFLVEMGRAKSIELIPVSYTHLIYPVNEKGLLNDALVFPKKGVMKEQLEFLLDAQERAVAQWSAANLSLIHI